MTKINFLSYTEKNPHFSAVAFETTGSSIGDEFYSFAFVSLEEEEIEFQSAYNHSSQ